MGVGQTLTTGAEDGVKSGCVGVLRLLSCFERVLPHYSVVLRRNQDKIHQGSNKDNLYYTM